MRPKLLQLTAVGAVLAVLPLSTSWAGVEPPDYIDHSVFVPGAHHIEQSQPESDVPALAPLFDSPLAASANPYDARWDDRFGISGVVYRLSASAVFNGDLIVSGERLCIDGQPFNNVARFDGTSWQSMGAGLTNLADCFYVFNGELYAAGYFSSTTGVARWTGTTWVYLPVGGQSFHYVLAEFDGSLILATDYHIYRYIGTTWVTIGSKYGNGGGSRTFAIYNGQLYVGGDFVDFDGSTARGIARWNGTAWEPVAGGIHGTVNQLLVHNGVLIAAGGFDSAGTVAAANIATWDGYFWGYYLYPGTDGPIYAMCHVGDDIYIGGRFFTAGSTAVNRVARWSGSEWLSLGTGIWGASTGPGSSGTVSDLVDFNGSLIASGQFWGTENGRAANLTRWSEAGWGPVGTLVPGMGLFNYIDAMVVYNGKVIVGGNITGTEDVPLRSLAEWDGSSWAEVGGGITGSVFALGVWNDQLVVGGNFSAVGGIPASNIALWDGSNWTPLATSMTPGGGGVSLVEDIEVFEGKLIIGGYFTGIDGLPIRYVAAWDGAQWSALGTGLDSASSTLASVAALTVYQDQLLAGGWFAPVDGTGPRSLARFNGAEWESFADIPANILDMTVADGDLIVAGTFNTVDGISTGRLARFDGSTWSGMPAPFGTDPSGFRIEDMLVYDGELVIAGWQQIGGGLLFGRWDGTSWRTFGSGVTSGWSVDALVECEGNLYLGGPFVSVGGKGSCGFAIWHGEHGCCLLRGDLDESGQVAISDLTYLVNHLFKGGPAAMCFEHADIDGAGVINMSDLVLLVGYLFKGGETPDSCPTW